VATPRPGNYLSGPDLTAFSVGTSIRTSPPGYKQLAGSNPISVFHAHAYDASNIMFQAITKVAVKNSDGSLTIPRVALRDAVQSTSNYQGDHRNPGPAPRSGLRDVGQDRQSTRFRRRVREPERQAGLQRDEDPRGRRVRRHAERWTRSCG